MRTDIPRNSPDSHCLWLCNGKEIESPWEEILRRFGISGAIRIHEKDFRFFPNGNLLTHFNLQVSGHKPDYIYALPKIIRPGFFNGPENEQLPLLDFSGCPIAKCRSVREYIPYDKIRPEDFEHSFLHIRNTDELKKEITWRYGKSMPGLTERDILSLGVSITDLEITGTL